MILNDKRFDSIKAKLLEDLYNRLMNRKSGVIEEKKHIRVNMIKKLCVVNNDEDIENILKGIASFLRNKKRAILLMGGNYEEVNMKTEKKIVKYMSTFLKETEESAQLGGASPTIVVASPTYDFEKTIVESFLMTLHYLLPLIVNPCKWIALM